MNLVTSSIALIKKNQSDTGAFIASPSLPIYQYSWFRDGSWIAHAMLMHNEWESAEKFHDWASTVILRYKEKIFNAIKKHAKRIPLETDFIDARYTIEGDEITMQWGNFQLDGLGVWLWSLAQYIRVSKKSKKLWFEAAALVCDYLQELWNMPCNDLWEENPDYIHTSTLASIYGGLFSFHEFFLEKNLTEICMQIKNFILNNCIYDNRLVKYVGSLDIDASLLLCAVPFHVFSPDDEIMKNTVSTIVRELKITEGLQRYTQDTYYGGGEWIILGCLLGLYYAKMGGKGEARKILSWVETQADKKNNLPEQINPVNQEKFFEWKGKWGMPANPLLWSHAMYLLLITYSYQ